MPDPIDPTRALMFLATAAKDTLRISQVGDFNLAIKALEDLIQDKAARDAIAADIAKGAAEVKTGAAAG